MSPDDDTGRAAVALLRAVLHGDQEGIRVICAQPPAGLAEMLAGMAVGALQIYAAQIGHDDVDQAVEEQLSGFLSVLPQA